jgi:hypothetical protein
MLAAHGKH